MADTEDQAGGTIETRAEWEKSPADFCKNWITAIEMAGKEEEDWRTDANVALDRYRLDKGGRGKNYNILYANTQTTVPALYNSEPLPDIRRRFMQKDKVGEVVASILERGIQVQAEMYDFDGCMKAAVKDRQLQGRGVTRVRVGAGEAGSKWVSCEPVIWDDFRRGPAKRWEDVPWMAYRHKLTREELIAKNATIGAEISLDVTVAGAGDDGKDKDGGDLPDMFKRATVWEIWDAGVRRVYWIAESYKDKPLAVDEDPYQLRKFYCTPKPLYAIESTDTLIPVCEYMEWKPLADEMDTLTKRISAIVAAAKWRGIYDGALESAVKNMSGLEDGQLAPAEDAARVMAQGAIDKSIWLMPVEGLVALVKQLYEARDVCKSTIYEITGVADIMRGNTNASETLGAQQLKAQWGSLRLQEAQRDVQRLARDLFRMMADLMSEVMELPELVAMTGVQIDKPPPQMGHNGGPPMGAPMQPGMPPQQPQPPAPPPPSIAPQVAQLLKGDLQREFIIEIETDSTIKGDLGRSQENISNFIMGFSQYVQGVLPAVQMGMMPPETAVSLARSFSRIFKLGRDADLALDEWEEKATLAAQQPKQPPPEDPATVKAKADAANEQQRMAMEGEEKKARFQLDTQKAAQENDRAERQMQADHAFKAQEMQFKRDQLDQSAMQHRETLMAGEASKQQDHAHAFEMERTKGEHATGLQRSQHHFEARGKQMEAEGEALKDPDVAKTLSESISGGNQALAEAVASLGQNLGQGFATMGKEMKEGLTALAQAEMAETELVRGVDGRPAGARKVMPRRN